MKKSNKLTAAGIGLLVAAALGLSPAFASSGEAEAPLGDNTLEVAGVAQNSAATEEDAAVEETEGDQVTPVEGETSETAVTEQETADSATDQAVAEEASQEDQEEESVSEIKVGGVKNDLPPVGSATKEKQSSEAVTEVPAEEEATADSKDEAAGKSDSALEEIPTVEPLVPADDAVAESPAKEDTDSVAVEEKAGEKAASRDDLLIEVPAKKEPVVVQEKSEVSTEAKEAAQPAPQPKKKAPVKIVKVDYVKANSSLATTVERSTNTVATVKANPAAAPKQLGPVLPLLPAVSERPSTPGTVNLQTEAAGAETPNGQSMVVWFELPPAEGPSLQPGEATAPLLGSAVTETAVNSNVIPATEVAPQALPAAPAAAPTTAATARAAAVPVAAVATVQERGVMARTLARTGSLAQYAAMLSAVAMVIGVGMLIGAAAARRKQEN